jgi:hypothetical protein
VVVRQTVPRLVKIGSVAKVSSPVLEGWKYMGGATIAFHLLKTSVFGMLFPSLFSSSWVCLPLPIYTHVCPCGCV